MNATVEALDEETAKAVAEWVESNEASITADIKLVKAEKLVEGVQALFENAGIVLSEEAETTLTESTVAMNEAKVEAELFEKFPAQLIGNQVSGWVLL